MSSPSIFETKQPESQASVDSLIGGAPASLDTLGEIATALAGKASAAQGAKADTALQPSGLVYVPDERRYYGPNTSDVSAVATGIAADAAFNERYAITNPNVIPANWPVDCYGVVTATSNNWSAKTSQSTVATVSTYRTFCDADELVIFTYASPFTIDLFVDGKPYASNPIVPVATAGFGSYGYQKITFTSAKPRLIEFRMIGGLVGLYVKKPYRCWKPKPDINPGIAVVGDSWVTPTVLSDTAAGNAAGDTYLPGIYQRMAALLGITKLVTDGIGGTGYLSPGGSNLPYGNSTRKAWVQAVAPDVLIVHGGGINDLYNGYSMAATQQAMIDYFTWAHSVLPNAKLVFMEGQYAPLAGFSSQVANMITLRQNVQSALAGVVPVYFVDVITTRAPINGTGYVTAANGSGNSDIYIGSDQSHPTVRGNQYIRHFLAPKIAKILADDGKRVGSLI